jgi:hypothetical protein
LDKHLKQNACICVQLPQLIPQFSVRVIEYFWSLCILVHKTVLLIDFWINSGPFDNEKDCFCDSTDARNVFQEYPAEGKETETFKTFFQSFSRVQNDLAR